MYLKNILGVILGIIVLIAIIYVQDQDYKDRYDSPTSSRNSF